MSAARDLVLLARPKGTLLLLAVPLTGYGFAHWDARLELTRPLAMAFVLAAWVLLSAGSLWLNAALDGDEGGALFAEGARHPKHLAVLYGYGALACAVALASCAGIFPGVACALCAAMAILYSHPAVMWKAHPVMGPLVNGTGYGLASFFAGHAVASPRMTAGSALAMSLLAVFVIGMTFAAQAYQREDDARRGYRTLVVKAGPAACLRVAVWCARATLAGVAVGAIVGLYPRLVLFGLPAFALAEITMARWRRAPEGGSARFAASYATRMLAGGAVLVALATVASLR